MTPPVIVTPLIETVGSVEPLVTPIVITGPPPRMIVAAAPEPTSRTLLAIVIPPENVPSPIRILSPSCAASTAAWIVA